MHNMVKKKESACMESIRDGDFLPNRDFVNQPEKLIVEVDPSSAALLQKHASAGEEVKI
jgi:hypothetical protein